MRRIFILGAGLSASTLIKYLLDNSDKYDWEIVVGDLSLETAQNKVKNHPNGKAIEFDIKNEQQLIDTITKSDVVISMLPAFMHPVVARECVKQGKHMLTASYVSNEMKTLDIEAKAKGIALMNELGVDPGIDHMSAMKVINEIKAKGGILTRFMSNTGGLVAPEYDNNPWNYKFTWNPRNVILAGQGIAQYKEEGKYKYVPYHQLFNRIIKVNVLEYGEFEVYPNRDSLQYREIYDIKEIPTILRGTMRRPGYAKAWQTFVLLGATDDTYTMVSSENMTYREFINSFLPYDKKLSVEEKVAQMAGIEMDSETMNKLRWLGIFENRKVELKNATPAQILQKITMDKWKLGPEDKDMIAMQHQFEYELNGQKKRITSSLVVEGEDTTHTAMSITVGTPLAIATKMLLNAEIKVTGVHTPTIPEIYEPILLELEDYKVKFIEEEETI